MTAKTKTKRASRGRPRALKRVPAVKREFKHRLTVLIASHHSGIDWENGLYTASAADGMVEVEFAPGEGLLNISFKSGGEYALSVNTLVDFVPPGLNDLQVLVSDPGMVDDFDCVEISSNSNAGKAGWDKFDQMMNGVMRVIETALDKGGGVTDEQGAAPTGIEAFLNTNYPEMG